MRTEWICCGCILALLTGCVTPPMVTPPEAQVNLREFRSVKLVVTDSVQSEYSREGVLMLSGLLNGKIKSLGYQVVDADAQMTLEVEVRAFDPGDRATRMLVGFGAGRAVLKYAARFKDGSGRLLTGFDGGKSYTGMELTDNATFKTNESILMGMIFSAVSEIGRFIQNDGRL